MVIGPLPPFVGGAAKNTALFCEALEDRGVIVHKIATNRTRSRAEHIRSFWTYLDRTKNFLVNLVRMARARYTLPNATVYLVPDGGRGLVFSAVYAFISALLFPRIVVHHRSYAYISRLSKLMAILVNCAPEITLHIFLDPVMKDKFIALYGDQSPYLIVSNAATCDVEPALENTPLNKVISIGFLSNMVEDKGFDVVSEAFVKISEKVNQSTRFLLAGRPIGKLNKARLLDLQDRLGSRLEYRGELLGRSKEEFFRDCDVFVFPTRFSQEAQPNVLFEAMAGGASIVSTDWAGVPSMLEGTIHRLVPARADNADAVCDAVIELINKDPFAVKEIQVALFEKKRSESQLSFVELLDYAAGKVNCRIP